VALALGVLSFALSAAGTVYAYRNSRLLDAEVDWSGIPWGLWPAAFVVVGVVVTVARPRILVGWGLLVAGFSVQVGVFGGAYAGWARLSALPLPLSGLAAWLGMVATGVFITTAPLVATRLPSGRPDTRMTRLTSRVSWVLGVALVAWWAFGDESLSINHMSGDVAGLPDLRNPLALVHPSRVVTQTITRALTIGLLGCFLTSIALVLARRRRASPSERAQLRWLGFGLAALPVGMACLNLANLIAPLTGTVADTVFGVVLIFGLGAIPVSIAVSVLKFRLFEIDRLISRTVVFAVVALVLGAMYAVLATLPSLVIGGSGDTPSWLVAASTLLAAALFSPLRRRVQRMVDRRFNRSRYDAERVLAGFSSQVREFTDVGMITSGLSGAVQGALQPAGVAVWVRGP
jgi:hypothetical protein